MKLKDISSVEFVPNTLFRDENGNYKNSYFTDSFDTLMRTAALRSKSLSHNSVEAFLNMSVDEQRQYLQDCGIEAFYSDVSPMNRAIYCDYIAKHLSSLSTQETLTELIKFIFDDRDLEVIFRHAYDGKMQPYVYEIDVNLTSEAAHTIENWVGQRLNRFIETFFPAHVSWNKGLQITLDTDPISAYVVLASVTASIYTDFGLITSEAPTQDIIVGVTTRVPAGTTVLQSSWFWMRQFTAGSIQNPYFPEKWPDNIAPTYNNQYESIPSDTISEVKIYEDVNNGVNLYFPRDLSQYPSFQFKCSEYSQKPECYTQGLDGLTPSMLNLGVMWNCSGGAEVPMYDLPGDLYSIDDTTVTWNTEHPLYPAFYRELVFPASVEPEPPVAEQTAYLYTQQYQATGARNVVGNSYLPSAGTWVIYVPDTSDPISYDPTKTYTVTGVYNAAGTDLGVAMDCEIVNVNGYCRFWYKVDGQTIKVNHITYEVA